MLHSIQTSDMTILFQRVFRLDYDADRAAEITIPTEETNDFTTYVLDLVGEALDVRRSRRYQFPDHDTCMKAIVSRVITGENIDCVIDRAAQRLHEIEKEAQKKIQHLDQEIQRGILALAMAENNGQKIFFIIKAEHFDYIDEEKKKKASGLPVKKKIYKSFVCYIKKDKPDYAMVSDSNTVISSFWAKKFLELEEEHDDFYNTRGSFDALDKKIFGKMKNDFPEDYMYLRNATVQYFRSKAEFVLDDYVKDIVNNYTPANAALPLEDIEQRISQLPEKEDFDPRFSIEKGELSKRIIKKLKLTDQLVLEVKEDIDWDSTVQAVEEKGIKYIRIRTDEGYKYFKKSQ